MVFVAVFFIRLGNDAAGSFLLLPLRQHKGVLFSRPLLKRRETEPWRAAILVRIIDGVAGSQMLVWIPLLEKCARRMSPALVAILVEVIAEIPGDIRKGA